MRLTHGADKAVEHFGDSLGFLVHFLEKIRVDIAEFRKNQKLGTKFASRSFGDAKKTPIFGLGIAFHAFRDVGRDRYSSPLRLVPKTIVAAIPKGVA